MRRWCMLTAVILVAALTGLPSLPAQAAPAALALGVNLHPLRNSPSDPNNYAQFSPVADLYRASALGAGVVRIDIHWRWLEYLRAGTDGWDGSQRDALDRFLDQAAARHVRVLATVHETPCWAAAVPAPVDCSIPSVREGLPQYQPRDPADYAAFITRLVAFAHGRIQSWEVWNEPNFSVFWDPPDPAAYTRLLRAAHAAIKAADPGALVVSGGLTPFEDFDTNAGHYPMRAFIDAMYTAGAKGTFDAFGLHPYTDGGAPGATNTGFPMHSYVTSVPAVRQKLLGKGDASPLWLTEIGWTTVAGCTDCGWNPGLPVSESVQATYLAAAIGIARSWDYVGAFIAYELIDGGAAASTIADDHFGLFRRLPGPDLAPKPAASAFQQAATSPPRPGAPPPPGGTAAAMPLPKATVIRIGTPLPLPPRRP